MSTSRYEDFIRAAGFGNQPNEFDGDAINNDDPDVTTPNAAWMQLYGRATQGLAISPPFFGINPFDPGKVAAASAAYQSVANGSADPQTLPDLTDLFAESAKPYLGFVPMTGADAKQIVQHRCGTCHDAVFFDKGVLTPPRRLAGTCKVDADCTTGGGLATCDTATSACYVRTHPAQTDDSQCATCHSADSSGKVPIALSHEEPTRTRVRGIKLSDLTIAGSGGGAAVSIGETLNVRFKLADGKGVAISDLKTNAVYSATLLIGGPNATPHLVLPSINARTTGTLTYDAQSGGYSYTTAAAFPANAQPPLNSGLAAGEPNVAGAYTAWLYIVESVPFNGTTVRDVATGTVVFRVVDAQAALQPRQVITRAACDSCHGLTQAHGGSRRDAGACFVCHNRSAKDRGEIGRAHV